MTTGTSFPGRRGNFLIYCGIALLAFTVIAFTLKVIVHPVRLERYTPPVMLHGILMLGWLVLFTLQAKLVQAGNTTRHKTLGYAGMALVAAIVISSLPLSVSLVREYGKANILIANSFMILTFVSLFAAAVYYARNNNFTAHKRLMLLATLSILGPPIARLLNILDIPELWALSVQTLFIILLPVIYDKFTVGKIHRASVGGIVFAVGMIGLMIFTLNSPAVGIIKELLAGNT